MINTCRFCKKGDREDEHGLQLLKYGVRHYAHPDCLLKAKGCETFDLLQTWQVRHFPALAAERHGLYDVLREKIKSADLAVSFGYAHHTPQR